MFVRIGNWTSFFNWVFFVLGQGRYPEVEPAVGGVRKRENGPKQQFFEICKLIFYKVFTLNFKNDINFLIFCLLKDDNEIKSADSCLGMNLKTM